MLQEGRSFKAFAIEEVRLRVFVTQGEIVLVVVSLLLSASREGSEKEAWVREGED
jgi:hypothetical protein